MNIAAVILNYNNRRDTLTCVESVLDSEMKAVWVVIVDNASTDDSVQQFRDWGCRGTQGLSPEVRKRFSPADPTPFFMEIDEACELPETSPAHVLLLRNESNGGYAAGINKAILRLMPKAVDGFWILNNDTIVDKNALGAMAKRLFSKERPGLCGARIHYFETDIVQCCAGGRTNFWTSLSSLVGYAESVSEVLAESPETVERRINFIYGACVLASREFIETVGLMDERYFLYCEEQDWAYRAKGRFDLAYAPDALVYHKEGRSTGLSKDKVSLRPLLYLTRSRILFTAKHMPWALPTVCLSIIFAAFRMVWQRYVAKSVLYYGIKTTFSANL
jgi:GT2 family glycosyltransferase